MLTGRGKGQSDCDTVEGVAIERINLSRNRFLRPESLLMYFRLLWHGRRMIRKIGPSVLLAARALPEGLVATTLGRSLRIPSVIFAHGEEISPFVAGDAKVLRRKWTTLLKGRMLWRAYRQADLIVANSCFTRELVCRGGIDPARVQVIHPGTDPVRFFPVAPDPVLLDSLGLKGRKVILTVGRLTWRKGQDTVIKALPTIAQAVPNVVYLVAGRGPYESGLKDMARTLNVENQVRFLGEVDPEALPSLYHCCDLFIMPNRVSSRTQDLEGFGIVFLEANACGKPVIGGNSGGVPDAIENGKSGLLVDGTSVEQVSAAVIRMLREPELADEMGRYGRQRVCERFTWDHAASSLVESITTLMSHLDKPPAD